MYSYAFHISSFTLNRSTIHRLIVIKLLGLWTYLLAREITLLYNMAFYSHSDNAIMTGEMKQVNLQTQDVDSSKKNLKNGRHTDRFTVMYISTQYLPFFF